VANPIAIKTREVRLLDIIKALQKKEI